MFTKLSYSINGAIGLLYYMSSLPFAFIGERANLSANIGAGHMAQKVVIITGANTGIGKETAINLCKEGANIVIASRDSEKSRNAVPDIISTAKLLSVHGHIGSVSMIPLDLSDLESVVNFVNIFSVQYDRLDVIINNAGLNVNSLSQDGLQQLFQVNYLGHYLLFRLLLQHFSQSNRDVGLRVVNLSSVMHHFGNTDYRTSAESVLSENDAPERSYYSDSKFYMNLLTMEINKKYSPLISSRRHLLASTSERISSQNDQLAVTAISVNPGSVRSDIWRHVPRSIFWIYDLIMRALYLTVKQGSMTSVYAASVSMDVLRRQAAQSHAQKVRSFSDPTTNTATQQHDCCCDDDKEEDKACRIGNEDMLIASAIVDCDTKGGLWCYHPLIPYIIPYAFPTFRVFGLGVTRLRLLAFEMLGTYAGPQFGEVSLPPAASQLSAELWEYSAELCTAKLAQKGISINFRD